MKRMGLENIQQFKNKIVACFNKWKEKREDKKTGKRIGYWMHKIIREMPELDVEETGGDERRGLTLPEKVRTYYEIKGIKSQQITNCVMALLTIAIIFLTALQFVTQKNQTELMAKQTELLEKSTPSYEPELRVWAKDDPLELSTQKLLNEGGGRERVEICIKNIGQTSTGHIYFSWQNDWTHNYNSVNIHPGIESGNTSCNWLELIARNCLGDREGCTETIIPKGWVDLNLSIKCDYCMPNELIKTLRACVWEGDSSKCRE